MGKTHEQGLFRQVLSDVHAPAKFRVNGPMRDIPDFCEAFDVKPGEQMWRLTASGRKWGDLFAAIK
ncbi:MAG TPA: M13-type metalloendopeptidase [Chitinophagaceae bacterium]|nr:M13-type metalloendopeptidase [Chitinophagaceae bacterium]